MRINSAFIDNNELYLEDKILYFSDYYGLMEIYHNMGRQTKSTKRIAGKAVQHTENQ